MSEMAVAYARHRISVDEYHRMAEAGVFDPDARIELIDGELIERLVPVKPPHAGTVALITRLLTLRLGERACVRCQLPVTITDSSEPEPDIAVVRFSPRRYLDSHPSAGDDLATAGRRARLRQASRVAKVGGAMTSSAEAA